MKIRRVNRYYCDYCKKANCSKPSIEKHERGCTLNPNRVCGVCNLMQKPQPSMIALRSSLPTRCVYAEPDQDGPGFSHQLTAEELNKIREASGNCPSCIMSVLRQTGIPVPLTSDAGFDYQKEMDLIWNDFWESKNNDTVESYY